MTRSVVAGVFRCARGASRFPSRSATAAAACLKWRFKRLRRMALVTSGCAGGATGFSAGSPGNSRGFRCRGWPPNAAFQSLAGGRDGSVWVGVEGAGLVRIREGQCVTFGAEQGLPATELVAVVKDDAGDLWLGGSQSVVRVNRASLEAVARRERERLECQVFDRQDGLPGPVRSGHQPACWKASDGRIWFATLRGIAVVDPQEVLPKLPPPTTAITEVMVEGKPWAGWEAAAGPLLLPAGLGGCHLRGLGPAAGQVRRGGARQLERDRHHQQRDVGKPAPTDPLPPDSTAGQPGVDPVTPDFVGSDGAHGSEG